MVCDTPPSQDVSTYQIWNPYLKESRRYGPDTKRDGRTDTRTDCAITICLPKFLWGHKKPKEKRCLRFFIFLWQINLDAPPDENSWIPACRPIDTNLEIMLEFLITIAGNFSWNGLLLWQAAYCTKGIECSTVVKAPKTLEITSKWSQTDSRSPHPHPSFSIICE